MEDVVVVVVVVGAVVLLDAGDAAGEEERYAGPPDDGMGALRSIALATPPRPTAAAAPAAAPLAAAATSRALSATGAEAESAGGGDVEVVAGLGDAERPLLLPAGCEGCCAPWLMVDAKDESMPEAREASSVEDCASGMVVRSGLDGQGERRQGRHAPSLRGWKRGPRRRQQGGRRSGSSAQRRGSVRIPDAPCPPCRPAPTARARRDSTASVTLTLVRVALGLERAHQLGEGNVFALGSDDDALHEELVTALCAGRRVLLHGLQEDCGTSEEASVSDLGRLVCRGRAGRAVDRLLGKQGSGSKTRDAPWTSTVSPGSILPEFGRTQYCLGAVVLTL